MTQKKQNNQWTVKSYLTGRMKRDTKNNTSFCHSRQTRVIQKKTEAKQKLAELSAALGRNQLMSNIQCADTRHTCQHCLPLQPPLPASSLLYLFILYKGHAKFMYVYSFRQYVWTLCTVVHVFIMLKD